VDNVRYLHGSRPGAVAPGFPRPPGSGHEGADPSHTVHVRIDDAACDAQVSLDPGWRTRVGVRGLGAAVAQAFGAAVAARLEAWAAAAPAPAPAAAPLPSAARPGPEAAAQAWRDLREFQVRMAELHDAATEVADPGARVRVTVRGGQVVAVQPEPRWAATARDADLVMHSAQALRAALAAAAALPDRALVGCPELRARLAPALHAARR
jgi:hypothetical protein